MSWRSPFNRAHDNLTDGLYAGGRQDRLDVRHSGLHRARRDEHLWHEDHVVAELDADNGHARDKPVIENSVCGEAVVERLSRQPVDLVVVAHDEVVADVLHQRVGLVPTARECGSVRKAW